MVRQRLAIALSFVALSTLCVEATKKQNTYDYIIVGGGTAGCALAAKLSDPDPVTGKFCNSVLVLEAGENETQNPLVLVNNIFGAVASANNPELSMVSLSYTQTEAVNPYNPTYYLEGRQWGGSSGHYYLQCVRGTPDVYNQWAAISGDPRWSYNNLLKNVMIPMEHYTPDGTIPDPTQRGFTGPLFITQEPPLYTDKFMQAVSAATEAPFVMDYNNPNEGFVGIAANQDFVTPPYLGANSYRSYSANAYLTGEPGFGVAPIVDENGNGLAGRKLKILSNTTVNRVIFSKHKTAKAVEYVHATAKDVALTVNACKEIILCAGSFEDPAILQRSGIGDPTLLNSLGIPVVFANSNVGANMQNQFGIPAIIGDVTTTVTPPRFSTSFIGLPQTPQERQFELIVLDSLAIFPAGITGALGITEGIFLLGVQLAPKSTGTVSIISKDPFIQPLINLGYFTDGAPTTAGTDANMVVQFYGVVQKIATQSLGTVLYPTPEQYIEGPDALFAAAFNAPTVFNHASGTCRMAKTATDGVIDGRLNVFGVNKLKVASNASVPYINKGNTGYTAFVVGLEAARIIRGA